MYRHLIFLLIPLILGCSKTPSTKVRISIIDSIQSEVPVKITQSTGIGETIITEGVLDSTGRFTTLFDLERPTLAIIQIGQKYGELYLEAGYDLCISVTGTAYTDVLGFTGEGSWVNSFINEINSTTEATKFTNGKGISNLTSAEFRYRIDSLRSLMEERTFQLNNQESPLLLMLKAKHKVKLAAITQEYVFYNLNHALNENTANINQDGTLDWNINSEMNDLMKKGALYDSVLLNLNSFDHYMLNNFMWQNQVNLLVINQAKRANDFQHVPLIAQNYILNKHAPQGIEQFMLAFDLDYRISTFGITAEIDSAIALFRQKYPNSPYDKKIERNYQSWLELGRGKPAPNFVGTTVAGDSVSIQSLKGKLIYVDVWATWCAPCIEEISFAKKLHQKFSNYKNLVFLNVSTDEDSEEWKNFLAKDKGWNGLHINIKGKASDNLWKKYKIFGIPSYFLIDQDGNIITVNAQRPSSGQLIEKELLSHLTMSQ